MSQWRCELTPCSQWAHLNLTPWGKSVRSQWANTMSLEETNSQWACCYHCMVSSSGWSHTWLTPNSQCELILWVHNEFDKSPQISSPWVSMWTHGELAVSSNSFLGVLGHKSDDSVFQWLTFTRPYLVLVFKVCTWRLQNGFSDIFTDSFKEALIFVVHIMQTTGVICKISLWKRNAFLTPALH